MRRRSWAFYVGALVSALIAATGLASANGSTPVAPNPSSQGAQDALAAVRSGGNAYSETIQFSQLVTIQHTGTVGNYILVNGWANVSNPLNSLGSSAALKSASYAIVLTNGCGSSCGTYTLQCDGASAPAPVGPYPCYSLRMFFPSTPVASLPVYNVTRTQELTYSQSQTWTSTSDGAALTSSVESAPPTIYGKLTTIHLTSWQILQVSWAVPLPRGSYNLAATTVQFLNTSTFLASDQFLVQSTWILIQWVQFPVSEIVGGSEPVSHAPVLRYQFLLEDTTPPVTGGVGEVLQQLNNTTTNPGNLTPSIRENVPIVATTLNISYQGDGNYTASYVLDNRYPFALLGPFLLESSLFGSSTHISVTSNGAPVGSQQFGISNTSVTIYPGAVVVPNGSMALFEVHFGYFPSIDPLAPFVFVNGYPVTYGTAIGVTAIFGAIGLATAESYYPGARKSSLVGAAEAFLIFGAIVLSWLYL